MPDWTDRSLSDDLLGLAENCEIHQEPEFWHPSVDSQQSWIENKKDPKKFRYLESQGWLDPTAIVYKRNKYGFRCDNDFDQPFDIMTLGCSYTFGCGVEESNTWPYVLGKSLNQSVANLGVLGASIQTCFRLLHYWLPKLKSTTVAVLVPYAHRLEVIVSEDPGKFVIQRYLANVDLDDPGTYLKEYWSTDYNSLLNRESYLMAIQHLCNQYSAQLVFFFLEKFEREEWRDHGRDFGHPGPIWHRTISNLFLEKIRYGQE